jgi:hypothetical protein
VTGQLVVWRRSELCRLCARPWQASSFCPWCEYRERVWSQTGEVECWLPIPGAEGYQVSSFGRVRSLDRVVEQRARYGTQRRLFTGQMLKPVPNTHGYLEVRLNSRRGRTVHRLVLEAFICPRPPGLQCCHRNDIKTNNLLSNLRWDSPSANLHDMVRNGHDRWSANSRTHFCCGHEITPGNTRTDKYGNRRCRLCDNKWKREHRRRDADNAQRRERHRRRNRAALTVLDRDCPEGLDSLRG